MNGLHIWGRMSSVNVKKVVWTAQELGLDFQRTEAGGMFGVVKTPGYMELNPNSLVPVIDDDGYVLWESNVIVRYLCAKYDTPTLAASRAALPPEGARLAWGGPARRPSPGPLYPTDLRERFDAERWMEWQQTAVNPASRPGFWQLIRTPAGQRDMAQVAESNAAVESLMATLDAHLAGRSFMVGERFTMADIPLACEVQRWFGLPQTRQSRPNIERWYANISARQTSKGVLDLPLS
ncbi:Glutathione S-transferase GstB [compost metagenome]